MEGKIKWGVVGPGKIAHQFVNDLKLVNDAVLTAVASRSLERATDFANTYKIPNVFDDYDALFASDSVDVLYIGTPHTFHKDIAIRAMKAGKHVLCEKPLGINAKEVSEMIAVAKENNVFLMEALWSRFNPTIQKVKALTDSGVLGNITYINADFAFYAMDRPPESRLLDLNLAGGTLLDIGIYPVFLAYLFLGSPKTINSISNFSGSGTEIQTSIIFQYPNAQAVLFSSFANDSTSRAEIGGEKGSITLNSRFHETQGYVLHSSAGAEEFELPTTGKGYSHEIMEVNNCLKAGKTESSLWSHQDSLTLISLLDEIRKQNNIQFPFEA